MSLLLHVQGAAARTRQRTDRVFNVPYSKLQAQFQGLEIRGATYTAYLDLLTSNTYVMVIVADPRIRECVHRALPISYLQSTTADDLRQYANVSELAAIKLNVELGREHFEKLQAINMSAA